MELARVPSHYALREDVATAIVATERDEAWRALARAYLMQALQWVVQHGATYGELARMLCGDSRDARALRARWCAGRAANEAAAVVAIVNRCMHAYLHTPTCGIARSCPLVEN